IFIFFGFFLFLTIGNSQELQWAKGIRGNNSEVVQFLEVDQEGNSYTMGYTHSSLFESYPNQIIDLSYIGVSYPRNIFIVKKDTNGNHLWEKFLSDVPLSEQCYGLKIGSDGYLYAAFLNKKNENPDLYSNLNSYTTILKLDLEGNEISRLEFKEIW